MNPATEKEIEVMVKDYRSKIADALTNDDEPITTELLNKLDEEAKTKLVDLMGAAESNLLNRILANKRPEIIDDPRQPDGKNVIFVVDVRTIEAQLNTYRDGGGK